MGKPARIMWNVKIWLRLFDYFAEAEIQIKICKGRQALTYAVVHIFKFYACYWWARLLSTLFHCRVIERRKHYRNLHFWLGVMCHFILSFTILANTVSDLAAFLFFQTVAGFFAHRYRFVVVSTKRCKTNKTYRQKQFNNVFILKLTGAVHISDEFWQIKTSQCV